MTFIVKDTSRDTERECGSRNEAEETKNDMISLGARPENIEIVGPKASDGGSEDVEAEIIDHTEGTESTSTQPEETLLDEKPSLDEDPVDWMPEHFVDTIQGVPTVNRKGYCVIAEQYGVEVTSEPLVRASESEFEYAEFKAIAITSDGRRYSGFGSAHIDRQDGDDPYLLNELAETRAMKRAVSWATGMGITAVEEMQGEL